MYSASEIGQDGQGSVVYEVKVGDTLKSIAQKFYSNEKDWEIIYEANKEKIGPKTGEEVLIEGISLCIPRSVSLVKSLSLEGEYINHENLRQKISLIFDDLIADKNNYKNSKVDYTNQTENLTELEPESEKFKRNALLDWPLKLLTGGFLFGLIGLLLSLNAWKQEQRSLELLDPVVQLSAPSNASSQYHEDVNEIYYSYGRPIDQGLEKLIGDISETESKTQEDGQASSLDSYQSSQIKNLENLRDLQANINEALSFYDSTEVESFFESNKDFLTDRTPEDIGRDFANIRSALEEISRNVVQEINDISGIPLSTKVTIYMTVENRSKVPNIIRGAALLMVYDETGSIVDIPLTISLPDGEGGNASNASLAESANEDNKSALSAIDPALISQTLPGNSATILEASSKEFGSMSQDDRDKILKSFEKEHKYLLIVQDVREGVWDQGGNLSNLRSDQRQRVLQNEAERLIRDNKYKDS